MPSTRPARRLRNRQQQVERTDDESNFHVVRASRKNERGAILIQVAVALLALLALSSYVFDYGVMWVSKGQAQTSADAGALSAAISLAFNSSTDQAAARARAIAVGQRNRVWGQAPVIAPGDVTFPALPSRRTGPTRHLREGRRLSQSNTPEPTANVYGPSGGSEQPGRAGDGDGANRYGGHDRLLEAVGGGRSLAGIRARRARTTARHRRSTGIRTDGATVHPRKMTSTALRPPPIRAPVTSCPQTRAASSPSRRAAVRTC